MAIRQINNNTPIDNLKAMMDEADRVKGLVADSRTKLANYKGIPLPDIQDVYENDAPLGSMNTLD